MLSQCIFVPLHSLTASGIVVRKRSPVHAVLNLQVHLGLHHNHYNVVFRSIALPNENKGGSYIGEQKKDLRWLARMNILYKEFMMGDASGGAQVETIRLAKSKFYSVWK